MTRSPDPSIRIAHDADFPPRAFADGGESRGPMIELPADVPCRIDRVAGFAAASAGRTARIHVQFEGHSNA
jgi:hypothetical protein